MTTTEPRAHRAEHDPRVPDARVTDRVTDLRVPVKVWQAPVRLIHWGLVGSITVLTVTGLYIGVPALAVGENYGLVMAWMRAIHLGAGLVFVALLIGRLIFMFTGNRWARWNQFIPVQKEYRREIGPALKFYLFLSKEPPDVVGHNPLAGMTYLLLFAMFTVQIFTGLALEAVEDRNGWMWAVSGWVYSIAPIGMVRFTHHLIMWLTWGFAVHHVYSAVLMDHIERSGVVSSMLSGWKNIPKDRL